MRKSVGGSAAAFAWVLGASVVFGAHPARAVEREHGIALGTGPVVFDVSGKGAADVGAGIGVSYTYGLTDAFNLMAEGSSSVVALNENAANAPTVVSTLNVGVGYVFDVIRWVPYAGLLAGSCLLSGGGVQGSKFVPDAAVALGFDYRFDRTWSAGLALRQYFFTDPGTYPSYSQAFARVEYTWGW